MPTLHLIEEDGKKFVSIAERDNLKVSLKNIEGKTITSFDLPEGNYVHPNADGQRHIPVNGNSNKGKFLMSTDRPGDCEWSEVPNPSRESLGINNVQNYGISTKEQAQEGTSNTTYMTPLRVAQAIEVIVESTKPATQTSNGLMSKEDKTKLDNVEVGANNYIHPNDANIRHVTDGDKNNWNGKLNQAGGTMTGTLTSREVMIQNGYALKHGANTIVSTDGKVYRAVFNDYAEFFEKEDENEILQAGDILAWHEKGVTKANPLNKHAVVGVYSDTYGMLLGGKDESEIEDNLKEFAPIGLAGRVNVKVKGSVKVGDFIIISDVPGVGRAATRFERLFKRGSFIGKVLEPKSKEGISRISVLIFNV